MLFYKKIRICNKVDNSSFITDSILVNSILFHISLFQAGCSVVNKHNPLVVSPCGPLKSRILCYLTQFSRPHNLEKNAEICHFRVKLLN